jgi:hypothetical protein
VTVVPPAGSPQIHVAELRLRRFRLGELAAPEGQEVTAHLAGCGACRVRLRGLDDEQRQFERVIPFERFAGGVERARRVPRSRPRPALYAAACTLAAAAALLLVWVAPRPSAHRNNIKGGAPAAEASLRVGSDRGEQQAVAPGGRLVLRPGQRVRLGVRSEAARYLAAVSVDEAGVVTALYPERGSALPLPADRTLGYLPDSLEFTGQGRERVFLVLAARAFTVEELREVARTAYQRSHGDLQALGLLPAEQIDEQFTWLLQKP